MASPRAQGGSHRASPAPQGGARQGGGGAVSPGLRPARPASYPSIPSDEALTCCALRRSATVYPGEPRQPWPAQPLANQAGCLGGGGVALTGGGGELTAAGSSPRRARAFRRLARVAASAAALALALRWPFVMVRSDPPPAFPAPGFALVMQCFPSLSARERERNPLPYHLPLSTSRLAPGELVKRAAGRSVESGLRPLARRSLRSIGVGVSVRLSVCMHWVPRAAAIWCPYRASRTSRLHFVRTGPIDET